MTPHEWALIQLNVELPEAWSYAEKRQYRESVWNRTIPYLIDDGRLIEIAYYSEDLHLDLKYVVRDLEKVRAQERSKLIFGGAHVVIDDSAMVQLGSMLEIGKTLMICVLLLVGATLSSHDINDLVLRPLELMMTKVNKLARDPFSSMRQGILEKIILEEL